MNYVKKKGCSTKKTMVHDQVNFLNDILAIVKMEDIPNDLILNWDHTGSEKGAKQIEMIALDDKYQITAVLCGALNGNVVPLTTACLPKVGFPKDYPQSLVQ